MYGDVNGMRVKGVDLKSSNLYKNTFTNKNGSLSIWLYCCMSNLYITQIDCSSLITEKDHLNS